MGPKSPKGVYRALCATHSPMSSPHSAGHGDPLEGSWSLCAVMILSPVVGRRGVSLGNKTPRVEYRTVVCVVGDDEVVVRVISGVQGVQQCLGEGAMQFCVCWEGGRG